MRAAEIEAWVLDIADRVQSNRPVEDFRVELKAQWPEDDAKAARRLAGHCNAARGEPALWVIGIDEERGVIGVAPVALPDWLSRVRRSFESHPPELLRDLNVSIGDKTVVAMLFNTDRAPYVVKNPMDGQSGAGPISSEVPWREGTRVRSARHEDLIRLLAPIQRLPTLDILEATLGCEDVSHRRRVDGDLAWRLEVQMYVVPTSADRVVIPFHSAKAHFTLPPSSRETAFPDPNMWTRHSSTLIHSPTVERTDTELIITGPGMVTLKGYANTNAVDDAAFSRAAVCSATLRPVGTERSIPIRVELTPPNQRPSQGSSVEWTSTSRPGADVAPCRSEGEPT